MENKNIYFKLKAKKAFMISDSENKKKFIIELQSKKWTIVEALKLKDGYFPAYLTKDGRIFKKDKIKILNQSQMLKKILEMQSQKTFPVENEE